MIVKLNKLIVGRKSYLNKQFKLNLLWLITLLKKLKQIVIQNISLQMNVELAINNKFYLQLGHLSIT